MQHTTLIISALHDMKDEFPNMTFGEILYTIFRKTNLKQKPEGTPTSWLLELKDEDVYNAIEIALKNEIKLDE